RGARAVAVAQVPGARARVERADRGLAVAVPVAHDRDPAPGAEGERGDVRGAGAVAVAQVPHQPGGARRIDHANAVLAVAVPVPRNAGPAGAAVRELPRVRGTGAAGAAEVPGRGLGVEGADRRGDASVLEQLERKAGTRPGPA